MQEKENREIFPSRLSVSPEIFRLPPNAKITHKNLPLNRENQGVKKTKKRESPAFCFSFLELFRLAFKKKGSNFRVFDQHPWV